MTRRRLRAVLVAAVLPMLVASCTVGPLDRPEVLAAEDESSEDPGSGPPKEVPLPPLGEPGDSGIGWTECGRSTSRRLMPDRTDKRLRYSCSALSGELSTGIGFLRLSLLRIHARGGGPKVPLVVVGDIDGEPGTLYAARLAARLPKEVLEKFTVIGFDRRGTGGSDPINCMTREDRRAELLDIDPASENSAELEDVVRFIIKECAIELGDVQGAYDARHSATDLDLIRAHLRVPRLHLLARGEGSRVVAGFVEAHPENAGRLVLDGVPDQAPQAQDVLEGVAGGAQAALAAFDEQCGADCPAGPDATKAVAALARQLRDTPRYTEDAIRVGPGFALTAVWQGLAMPERWDELARAIAEARDGYVEQLAAFARPVVRKTKAGAPTLETLLATTCSDTRTRLGPDRMAELADQWQEKYAPFGGLVAQRLAWCAQWPVPRDYPPGLDLAGAPPTLVISTEADPLTPGAGTTRSASQMAGAARVSWLGAGHGAVGRSACVDAKVVAYLVGGKVPGSGVTCPT